LAPKYEGVVYYKMEITEEQVVLANFNVASVHSIGLKRTLQTAYSIVGAVADL
jgi:hypothetical protein